ncbi:MAG: SRPBCC domain-containing protein [Novosphingobium sp.]|uniref:SRPBCC domain-containing protein n=1 Tax=Novosphingobium sp. TaxID=1874826 RepID=UPI0030182429
MNALTITRTIAAPHGLVWDVLVNRMEDWWCPKPWRAEIVLQERRAGGAANMVMHGPNGELMPNEGLYLAWEEGRRFVVTDAVKVDVATGAFLPSGPFMIGSWEVAAEGDGTRYTASARHWTEDAMKQHQDMGFEAGWNAAADQLQALCEAG